MPDTNLSTPTAAPEPVFSGGGDDFMSFDTPENRIDDSENSESTTQSAEAADITDAGETPTAETTGETTEEEAPDSNRSYSFEGIKPEVVALIKHLAKTSELDLNNPRDFKVARQLAEKESRIRELSKATEPSKEAKSYLDSFRDAEEEKKAAPATEQTTQQQTSQPTNDNLPKFVQKAMAWKNVEDFANDLMEAYSKDDGPEKNAEIAQTYLGFFDRTFHQNAMPIVADYVERMLNERLGPVMNEVRASNEQSQRRELVERLAQQPGREDIMEMFEPLSDKEVEIVSTTGERMLAPDTWLNRVLAEYPSILNIEVKGRNRAETERLTTVERYASAHRLMKGMRKESIDTKQAKGLVKTGIAIAESKRDPIRTGLNSGKSGVPSRDSAVEDIFGKGSGNGKSLADLFS